MLPEKQQKKQSEIKVNDKGEYSISLYDDDLITPDDMLPGFVDLAAVYEKTPDSIFNVISRLLIKNKFTKQQFYDAVDHVLSNHRYPEVKPADIISFDKSVKLYTYNQMTCMLTSGQADNTDFLSKQIDGKLYYVLKTEL